MSVENNDALRHAAIAAALDALKDHLRTKSDPRRVSVSMGAFNLMGRLGFADWDRPGENPRMTPLYEITVDGEDLTIVSAAALMEVWAGNAPEALAKALRLRPEGISSVCEIPRVQVRRIR